MSGIDRIGPNKGPTGPLGGNGVAQGARQASGGPAASEAPQGSGKDSVAPQVQGKSSRIDASDQLPEASDASRLPDAVAAFSAPKASALATLLDKGLPLLGAAGLRKLAERLASHGTPGASGSALGGEALNRLKLKVQIGDANTVVKPADIGLIGITF
ncbi:MAG: hypothetical protein FJZ01_08290 [Candidatus Sericytochromatia bacterium]|nr:hypothetical protein [Candidatus Tanganyikabacteria bacterium]